MKFTILIALIGVAAASQNPDVLALASLNKKALKDDMRATLNLIETLEQRNAPVMFTTIAARVSLLEKEIKVHPERKEEIRAELKTLLALTELIEKEDFDAGLAALGARKDHLMSLHKEFYERVNAADLAKD